MCFTSSLLKVCFDFSFGEYILITVMSELRMEYSFLIFLWFLWLLTFLWFQSIVLMTGDKSTSSISDGLLGLLFCYFMSSAYLLCLVLFREKEKKIIYKVLVVDKDIIRVYNRRSSIRGNSESSCNVRLLVCIFFFLNWII